MSAVFARHPTSVSRLFFDPETGRRAGDFSRYLARERRIYRQVPPEELERIAGTVHHGGIVAITVREEAAAATLQEIAGWAAERRSLVLLDRVANAHNLGALIRTAAFFGVKAVLHGRHQEQAVPGEATYRIAEGGMEHLEVRPVDGPLAGFLRAMRPHYLVVGAALQGEPLAGLRLPPPGSGRPTALVLGNEEHGLSPSVLAACEKRALIPGTGAIESLNVAAAGAILMHWCFAEHR